MNRGDLVKGIDYGERYLVLGFDPHHPKEAIVFDLYGVDLIEEFSNWDRISAYENGGAAAELEYLVRLVLNTDRELPTERRHVGGLVKADLSESADSVLGVKNEPGGGLP